MSGKPEKKRKKLHEYSLDSDIKYRGPLSYRHLRILGWLCIAASQVLVLVSLSEKIDPGAFLFPRWFSVVLLLMKEMTIAIFILANFALILDIGNGYKKQLLTNGLAAGGIAGAFIVLYLRYGVGIATMLMGDRTLAMQRLDQAFGYVVQKNSVGFNIFVDLFLCTLLTFFLNYRPRKFFTGKKLIWFRLFSVVPILYEAASIVLKCLATSGILVLPVIVYPFLTTKPLLMFLVFLVLSIIIKNRERLFCKNGRTREEYLAFLKTNHNSLHFSVFTAITFAVFGIFDVLLYFFLLEMQLKGDSRIIEIFQSLGIGIGTYFLLFLSPFVLLFSYTRRYKNTWPDSAIPIAGIFLVIVIYLEGFYQGMQQLLAGLLNNLKHFIN